MKNIFFSILGCILCCNLALSQYSENQTINPYILNQNSVYKHKKIVKNSPISETYLGSCIPDEKHFNSVWFYLIVSEKSTVEMNIIPELLEDDIDFVVFKRNIQNGLDHLEELRCMSFGPTLYSSGNTGYKNCLGVTGLVQDINQLITYPGCPDNIHANYLSAISAEKGDELFIHVMNFGSTRGFSIEILTNEDISTTNPGSENVGNELALFPNPARNEITLNVKQTVGSSIPKKVVVYNSSGIIVHSIRAPLFSTNNDGTNSTMTLPINDMSGGIHFIVVTFDDNTHIYKPFYKY